MIEMKYKKIDNQLITIKISDMLKSIYLYRKKIIISSIVFAMLIMVVMLCANKSLSETEMKELVETMENSQKSVETNTKLYADQIEYNEKAIYQKLDYKSVETVVLQYWIDAEVDKVYDVMVAYIDYYNNSFISDIKSKDSVLNSGYPKDIIKMTYNLSAQYDVSSTLTFVINGENTEKVYNYAKVVEDVIKAYREKLIQTDLKHEIKKVYENHYVEKNESVYTAQRASIDKVDTIQKAIDDGNKVIEECEAKLKMSEAKSLSEKVKQLFTIKSILLAVIGGVLASGVLYVVNYIFSSKVKFDDEVEELTYIKKLGAVSDVENICFMFDRICDKENIKNIGMVWLKEIGNEEELYVKSCKEKNISVSMITDDMKKVDMLEAVANKEGIVLVIKLKATKYQQVDEIIRNCMNCNVNILGYIYEN